MERRANPGKAASARFGYGCRRASGHTCKAGAENSSGCGYATKGCSAEADAQTGPSDSTQETACQRVKRPAYSISWAGHHRNRHSIAGLA